MKSLPVIPHEGIGPLKLGMSSEQILNAVTQVRSEWPSPDQEVQISKDIGDYGFTRYMTDSFFFMVQCREVGVAYTLREHASIMIYDMDVFRTPAKQLVKSLKQFSTCSCDDEDERLGTNYEFSVIGVRLWREHPFHLDLLSDESYMSEMALVIDEMYHYLYFEIIAVKQ